MVRAVLFDFYGTLARAVGWGASHEEVFARHGFVLDRNAWERWAEVDALDGTEHVEHSASREAYVAWELERMRRHASDYGVDPDRLEALVADLYAASKVFTLEAYAEVPEVLAALREAGTTVAVCSNWDWDLDRALTDCGLDSLVDVAVTSAQAGARKPHPRIYQVTLERCGVERHEALFVGDTWGPDIEGPLAYGLRPIHLRRADDQRPSQGNGVPTAADLRAVLGYV